MGWRDVNLPHVKALATAIDKFRAKSFQHGPPVGFAKMIPVIERCQLIGDTRFDDETVCKLLLDSIEAATEAVEEGFVHPKHLGRLEANVVAMEKLVGFTAKPISHQETSLGPVTTYDVRKLDEP
jgi:hypothetical protein